MKLVLIPILVNGEDKKPLIPYKGYKNKPQDFQTLQGLYEQFKNDVTLQWAVYAINGVVGIDWDTPKDYETFFADIDTLTIKTPNGYHSYLKTLVTTKPFNHLGVNINQVNFAQS